jgi:ring-1,2-phenylacetyl-CoA epoxidase subunit PaaE
MQAGANPEFLIKEHADVSLFHRLTQLGSDLIKIVVNNTSPTKPAARKPFRSYEIAPPVSAAATSLALMHPVSMKVLHVIHETTNAVSLVLTRLDEQAIRFIPGMFFTVIVTIDGREYRRAYSISSSSLEQQTASITVKRIQDGLVSGWINQHIAEGDVLRVLGPSGTFIVQPDASKARQLLLVGSGSGITPLMSIAKSILAIEPESSIQLLYGNRCLDDIIFFDELEALQKTYAGRFRVLHVLKNPSEGWQGGHGRLDAETFPLYLKKLNIDVSQDKLALYMCGPEAMMEGVRAALLANGMPVKNIHQERFTPAPVHQSAQHYKNQSLTILANGKTWQGTAKPDETLLETGLSLSAEMVFSCTMGGCGRCRVKILNGEVDMDEPNCLMPEERKAHYALACISRPLTAVTFEVDPPSPITPTGDIS